MSVCLASYNGALFLERQLASIIADLEPQDEIILNDDASTDETIAIARSFADSRIKIETNTTNLGHVRNFERALCRMSGDVVFLSDQDDIWMRGKRDAVLDIFNRKPTVSMVVHALALINAQDNVIAQRCNVWPSKQQGVQPFVRYLVRQIFKNQVTGCAVAFRRELLDIALPFPSEVYAHDHWLSVTAPFAGEVHFLDEILLKYRQHDSNVTPRNGLSTRKRIAVRVKLAKLLMIAGLRAHQRRGI